MQAQKTTKETIESKTGPPRVSSCSLGQPPRRNLVQAPYIINTEAKTPVRKNAEKAAENMYPASAPLPVATVLAASEIDGSIPNWGPAADKGGEGNVADSKAAINSTESEK